MPRLDGTDLEVFQLCLGGNIFGWTANEQQTFAVLDAYAAAGGNFLDTADAYCFWIEGGTVAALDDVAAAHSVPVAAVALAWLEAQPTVAAPIASARTPEQLAALLPMATLELSDEEIGRLSAASCE